MKREDDYHEQASPVSVVGHLLFGEPHVVYPDEFRRELDMPGGAGLALVEEFRRGCNRMGMLQKPA